MVSQWVDELGARPTDWVDGPSGGNVWQLYTKDTTSLPGRIAEKRPGVVLDGFGGQCRCRHIWHTWSVWVFLMIYGMKNCEQHELDGSC